MIFYTFSTWRRTRFLKRCFSIWLEWRSLPSRCFGCSLLSAVSWTSGSPFYELHVAAMRDEGQDFLGAPVSVTGAGGAGVARSFFSQVTRHRDCQLDRSVVST